MSMYRLGIALKRTAPPKSFNLVRKARHTSIANASRSVNLFPMNSVIPSNLYIRLHLHHTLELIDQLRPHLCRFHQPWFCMPQIFSSNYFTCNDFGSLWGFENSSEPGGRNRSEPPGKTASYNVRARGLLTSLRYLASSTSCALIGSSSDSTHRSQYGRNTH